MSDYSIKLNTPELVAKLDKISTGLTNKIAIKSVRIGMRLLVKKIRANAAKRTGVMAKSVTYKTNSPASVRRTRIVRAYIFAKRDYDKFSKSQKDKKGNFKVAVPHAYYQNNGTKYIKATRFMNSTFNKEHAAIGSAIVQALDTGLAQTINEVLK